MNILILTGHQRTEALYENIKDLYPKSNITLLVNSTCNDAFSDLCSEVTGTCNIYNVYRSQYRIYENSVRTVNKCYEEFYCNCYNLTKGHELEEVTEKLNRWGLSDLVPFANNFFKRTESLKHTYVNARIASIIYAEMFAEMGEHFFSHFTNLLNITDKVLMNSFDVYTPVGNIDIDKSTDKIEENKNDITSLSFESNGTYNGLLQDVVTAVNNADLIIIPDTDFWHGTYSLLMYGDLYKYIMECGAKKIYISSERDPMFTKHLNCLATEGVDVQKFEIVQYTQEDYYIHEFAFSQECAKQCLRTYYGIRDLDKFSHIIFDYDALWNDSNKQSIENIRSVNMLSNTAIIANEIFEKIRSDIAPCYGSELTNFNVDVWADVNSCLYKHGKLVDAIPQLIINDDINPLVEHLAATYALSCTVNNHNICTCIKIRNLSQLDCCLLANYMNDFLLRAACMKNCMAVPYGKDTLNIVTTSNDKAYALTKVTIDYDKVLYITTTEASDEEKIITLCGVTIKTNDVEETATVIKLLEDEFYGLRFDSDNTEENNETIGETIPESSSSM